MRGSRNFHERGSNENGNFWSQTRGGPTSQKSQNYLFYVNFQIPGGGGSGPPVPPSGSAHETYTYQFDYFVYFGYSIPNNHMRQYTVNIRCMYDVTDGEINYLFVYLFLL